MSVRRSMREPRPSLEKERDAVIGRRESAPPSPTGTDTGPAAPGRIPERRSHPTGTGAATTVIERALELAGDGRHRSLADIRATLKAERRVNAAPHLAGRSINQLIRDRMRAALAASSKETIRERWTGSPRLGAPAREE